MILFFKMGHADGGTSGRERRRKLWADHRPRLCAEDTVGETFSRYMYRLDSCKAAALPLQFSELAKEEQVLSTEPAHSNEMR